VAFLSDADGNRWNVWVDRRPVLGNFIKLDPRQAAPELSNPSVRTMGSRAPDWFSGFTFWGSQKKMLERLRHGFLGAGQRAGGQPKGPTLKGVASSFDWSAPHGLKPDSRYHTPGTPGIHCLVSRRKQAIGGFRQSFYSACWGCTVHSQLVGDRCGVHLTSSREPSQTKLDIFAHHPTGGRGPKKGLRFALCARTHPVLLESGVRLMYLASVPDGSGRGSIGVDCSKAPYFS